MEKEWYVVNTYSGHEAKVKEKLESRAVSMGMQDHIFRVIVPETTEVDIKEGEYIGFTDKTMLVSTASKLFFSLLYRSRFTSRPFTTCSAIISFASSGFTST